MKHKKVISILLTAAILAGAGYGITRAVRATTSQNTVTVYKGSDLNFGGGYWDNSQNMQGMVTTDASQNIYVTDTDEIRHVYVQEGQAVHEGDVLLEYDTTKTNLNLQKEELNNRQIRLNIEVAQRNIATLRKMKPVSNTIAPDDFTPVDPGIIDDGGEDPGDNSDIIPGPEPENPDATPTPGPTEPEKPVVYKELTADTAAKNAETADGTAEKPYIYLCQPDESGKITIGTGFLGHAKEEAEKEKQKQRYIVLEILDEKHQVVSAWMQDVLKLDPDTPVTVDASTGKADFADLSEMTADQIAKALEGIDDTEKLAQVLEKLYGDSDKLSGILKKMDKDTRTRLLEALKEQEEEEQTSPSSTPDPNPGITETPTPAPGESDQPSEDHSDPTVTPETSSSSETAKASEKANNRGNTPASITVSSALAEAVFADCKTYTRISGEKEVADPMAAWDRTGTLCSYQAFLTSDQQTTGGASDGGDTGNGSGGSGLISPNAEYSPDDLKEALKDQENQLSDLQLDLQESDLKVRIAQQAVTDGVVKAKMNGTVKKAGDPENPPTDGSPFLQLTGAAGLYVEGGVYENRLSSIKEGTEVTVTSWQSGNSYQATVKSVSPYPDTSGMYGSDSSNSIYPFIAYIDDADAVLTNGEYVQITAASSAVTEKPSPVQGDGLYLLGAFILDENGRKYVYMRDADKKLKKQEIKVGKYADGSYEIVSGVTPSDWLAFPYDKDIKEGAATREGTLDELYS